MADDFLGLGMEGYMRYVFPLSALISGKNPGLEISLKLSWKRQFILKIKLLDTTDGYRGVLIAEDGPCVYRAYLVNSGFNYWLEKCIGAGSGVGNERSSLRASESSWGDYEEVN